MNSGYAFDPIWVITIDIFLLIDTFFFQVCHLHRGVMGGLLLLNLHRGKKLVIYGLLVLAVAKLLDASTASSFLASHATQRCSEYIFSLALALR